MQHHDFAFRIAEDKDVAITEVGFLDRFFEGHGTHRDGFFGAHQVNFGGAGNGGKLVDDDVDRRLFGKADGNSYGLLGSLTVPFCSG